MLPDGFIDLVEKIREENPLEQHSLKNKSMEKLWEDFTWVIFLDNNRNIAEVTYINKVLWDEGLLDRKWILNNSQQDWVDKTKTFISKYVKRQNGRKKGALNGLLSDLSMPAQSLKQSAIFFKDKDVSPKFLRTVTVDKNSIDKFLGEMSFQPNPLTGRINPYKINKIGITKALLWLQIYGLTKDYCPPSRQIKDFVESWMKKDSSLIHNDFQYILYMRDFNKNEVKPIILESTTRDAGLAVWYWKSTQNLLKGKVKKQLTPKKLLMYLDLEKLSLDKLDGTLSNIDKIDDLANDIKEFLER